MAEIIDGKAIAQKVKQEAAQEAQALKRQGVEPTIAVVLVGDNQASKVYVRNKMRACEQTGIRSIKLELPETVSQQELLERIGSLAAREDIHGILVQLPLPQQIDEQAVLQAIPPEKDVDGFHPQNVGPPAHRRASDGTLYPGRDSPPAGGGWRQPGGQALRDRRAFQHCRQACRRPHAPERRYCDHLPLQDRGSQ